ALTHSRTAELAYVRRWGIRPARRTSVIQRATGAGSSTGTCWAGGSPTPAMTLPHRMTRVLQRYREGKPGDLGSIWENQRAGRAPKPANSRRLTMNRLPGTPHTA